MRSLKKCFANETEPNNILILSFDLYIFTSICNFKQSIKVHSGVCMVSKLLKYLINLFKLVLFYTCNLTEFQMISHCILFLFVYEI